MSSNQRSSSSGGVRDLRAMFEKKDDSNPASPDRGRSPSNTSRAGNSEKSPSTGSRKIRSNFVNVDSAGQMSSTNTEGTAGRSVHLSSAVKRQWWIVASLNHSCRTPSQERGDSFESSRFLHTIYTRHIHCDR